MKQLLQNLRSGETTVLDVPIPSPKPGTALVRTAASLVSAGTERMVVEFAEKSLLGKARSRPDLVRQALDKVRREGVLATLDAALTRLDQPMPLGYSSAGTIQTVGEGLHGFHVGQRVACAGGRHAVHAEYAVVPRNLLALLPDQVDFESAAFTTLGAIALHGFRLAGAQVGERVAVIGLGLLGLLAVKIAQAAGCTVLGIDLDADRVDLARQSKAQAVLRNQAEEAAVSFSRGRGCDAVLICADTPSNDPVVLAGAIARDRAQVVALGAVGLDIPRKVYYEKELAFINSRSYGPGRYDPSYEEKGLDYPIGYVRWTEGRNLEAFVDLLATGQVDVRSLITHRFPIQQGTQAYQLITRKVKEPFLGVLLTYPQGDQPETQPTSLIVATSTPGNASMAGSPVRLGVLGAGNFASAVLLPAIGKAPEIEKIAIASGSGLSAQHAARKFGFRYACSDERQILEDPEITSIAVLTRHHLHASQVLAALAAGKHVFCEKPLALSPLELEEIFIALGEAKSHPSGQHPNTLPAPLLTVGYNRRFAPLALRLHEFVSQRTEPLVAHYRVNAGYLPPDHWLHDPQQGGGRIVGEGCHFIDFLTFLTGASPILVSARGIPDSGRYHEDNLVITLGFPDGSLGTIAYLANGDKAYPKERLEVFGAGRIAVLEDFRSLEMVCAGKRNVSRSIFRQDKGHLAEWQAFARAIASGGPPPIPYEQLYGVSIAAFAARDALRSGETIYLR